MKIVSNVFFLSHLYII